MMQDVSDSRALSVDIGGTKIAAAILDVNGKLSHRKEVPSHIQSAETMFLSLTTVMDEVLQSANLSPQQLSGVGVCLPGKVDSTNGVAVFQNNLPWENFPLVQRLQAYYPIQKIVIENDVKAAAYAEYQLAHLSKEDIFYYMTLSTGIASAVIVDDKILRGAGFSGETGYVPVHYDNRKESLEMVAAGPAIQIKGREAYQNETLTTADLFKRWQKQEDLATQIIEASIQEVAKTLYHAVCLLDPTKIVLGGSVAVKNPMYVTALQKYLEQWLYPNQTHILNEISVSNLGSDNGILGAGFMVLSSLKV